MTATLDLKTTEEDICRHFSGRDKPLMKSDELPDIDRFYLHFITHFSRAEISSDFVPFMHDDAVRHNRYMAEENNMVARHFWWISTAIQGDMWFIDKKSNLIFHHDHDIEELDPENFVNLRIDFFGFLQFLFLCKDHEDMPDHENGSEAARENFVRPANKIHPDLLENFPFDCMDS